MSARGKYATLAGVLSLVGVMGLFPLWIRTKMSSPIPASEKALTGSQIQRRSPASHLLVLTTEITPERGGRDCHTH